jgi:hypothetical protein
MVEVMALRGGPRGFTGSTQAASVHVQLSPVESLEQLSIMRDFDPAELRTPLPDDLVDNTLYGSAFQ